MSQQAAANYSTPLSVLSAHHETSIRSSFPIDIGSMYIVASHDIFPSSHFFYVSRNLYFSFSLSSPSRPYPKLLPKLLYFIFNVTKIN